MPQEVDFAQVCLSAPDPWRQTRRRSVYDWAHLRSHRIEQRDDLAHAEERWSKEVRMRYVSERRIREVLAGSWRKGSDEDALEKVFHENVERWKIDTLHWSSVARMVAHPSYLRIIGLASYGRNAVLRLLIEELQKAPDYWFAALEAITGENPVSPAARFGEAVSSWVEWWESRSDDARRTAGAISEVS